MPICRHEGYATNLLTSNFQSLPLYQKIKPKKKSNQKFQKLMQGTQMIHGQAVFRHIGHFFNIFFCFEKKN